MLFEVVESPGLAQRSYLVGSGGAAVVVDPRRDYDCYLKLASRFGVRIGLIVETHIHEDFLVGSVGLAQATGAVILRGPSPRYRYGREVHEGERVPVGRLVLRVLETPGHTPESISLVVSEEGHADVPLLVCTGDALLAGTVGRTDLFGGVQRRRLSERLFESLHVKLLPLGDQVVVCPAHGSGSVCGVDISERAVTSIGYERQVSRVLGLSKAEFVEEKSLERLELPPYFRRMAALNPQGLAGAGAPPAVPLLSVEGFAACRERGQVVDVRTLYSFAGAHIPGSLNLWAEGLPFFAGWLLEEESPIVFVGDTGFDAEGCARACYRCGYDRFGGVLAGGVVPWAAAGRPVEGVPLWSAAELRERMADPSVFVLDVRSPAREVIPGAYQVYAGRVPVSTGVIPREKTVVVYCEHGLKTGMVVSLLRNLGYPSVVGLAGGVSGWLAAGFSLESVGESRLVYA